MKKLSFLFKEIDKIVVELGLFYTWTIVGS